MKRASLSWLLLAVLHGQTPARKDIDAYNEQRKILQEKAQSPFDREMAREKTQDCGGTTVDLNNCLSDALKAATANHQSYAGALRAILAQRSPWPDFLNPGPTGVPLTQAELIADFDQLQAAWERYRDAMCVGAAGLVKSGTAWHSYDYRCRLMVLDDHMRVLATFYSALLMK